MNLDHWTPRFEDLAGAAASDAAHDLAHVRRVVRTAEVLAAAEGARREIIVPAAWLHDCVGVAKDSPDRARASSFSAVRAVEALVEIGYPAEWHGAIFHCIEAHSFSAGVAPCTIEAQVVQDADRIDALGAIGIARCFAVGGALQRAVYSECDPFCEEREPDDATFTVDHFFAKLLRLPEGLHTGAGRREAAGRVGFMRGFLRQLECEVAGDDRGILAG